MTIDKIAGLDLRTAASHPLVAAALTDLALVAARIFAMAREDGDLRRSAERDLSSARYAIEQAKKETAEAQQVGMHEVAAAASVRTSLRSALQILAPSRDVSVGYPNRMIQGDQIERMDADWRDPGYLRGIVDAAATVLRAAT